MSCYTTLVLLLYLVVLVGHMRGGIAQSCRDVLCLFLAIVHVLLVAQMREADWCCRAQERKLSELTGHTKRVTDAKFLGHQDLMVSTSADKTTRLWAVEGDAYKCKVHTRTPVQGRHANLWATDMQVHRDTDMQTQLHGTSTRPIARQTGKPKCRYKGK